MDPSPIEAGELLRRWRLPRRAPATGHAVPPEVGTLFRLRAQPAGRPELDLPGRGPHFTVGCQTAFPGTGIRAWFGADAETGVVRFVRQAAGAGAGLQQPSFVNRDLYAFADALRLRNRLIDRLDPATAAGHPDEVAPVLLEHAAALWEIDPAALTDPTGFWPASIWPMWAEWAPDPGPFLRFLAERRAGT